MATLPGVLGETDVLAGFVVLGPDAAGGDGWCDPHAATPAQAISLIAVNRTLLMNSQ
ncbi:hypothetical protein [Mycobacterium sp. IS-1264]|uniref:hypothetical protein n=1 Tax=Mycobacterium sp. IS-1264 TaxID=1834158 RepID=UPI001F0B486D|nr:hypothetical protein [Mycobacterium sp. IS-1264]